MLIRLFVESHGETEHNTIETLLIDILYIQRRMCNVNEKRSIG